MVEIGAAQLRPYVELISGAEPPRPDESDGKPLSLHPAMNTSVNGNGVNGNGVNGNGASAPGRAVGYAQPPGRAGNGSQPPVPSAADQASRPGLQSAALDGAQGDLGQQERVDGGPGADYAAVADFGASVDYSASVDYGAAADYATTVDPVPADQAAAVDYGSALEYSSTVDYGPVPDYAAPALAPMPAPVPVPVAPREDVYGAPVAFPAPGEELAGDRDRDRPGTRPRLGADLAAYNPGAVREAYQREGMLRDLPAGDNGDRLQPVPVALPGGGSAQVRRLPTRGPVPNGPNPGQPPLGQPPVPPDAGLGQQPGGQLLGGHQLGGQPSSGQPTGGQPAVPVAPVVPMDYPGPRGGGLGGPRHVVQGPGGPGPQVPSGAQQGPQVPPVPQGPPAPPIQQVPGGQHGPGGQQDIGGPAGPIGLAGQGGYAPGAPGVSLSDAVQSAHEEGQAFGESVARDAPALWLEAVLARKPRMPSDLEARLLQGSALPIDFLLHDEVRHALRRGFWDALERARR
jgi:hypothetical protein